MGCYSGKHMFCLTEPQEAVIGEEVIQYFVCDCGDHMAYDGIEYKKDDFCKVIDQSREEHNGTVIHIT
jgi:hypothetical protein